MNWGTHSRGGEEHGGQLRVEVCLCCADAWVHGTVYLNISAVLVMACFVLVLPVPRRSVLLLRG